MAKSHILGFPRIGANRELKKALETYWKGEMDEAGLRKVASEIRNLNWSLQAAKGLDYVTAGDFAFYDQILDFSVAMDIVPERYRGGNEGRLDLMFRMARGRAPKGKETTACEMTKWFDTNYHYIVPEFTPNTQPKLFSEEYLAQVKEAKKHGQVKFVIPGPLTYLWIGKEKDGLKNRLSLLPRFKSVYIELFKQLKASGVELLQIDEPALVLDIPADWLAAMETFYNELDFAGIKTLLATYFGEPAIALEKLYSLPVDGFHLDFVRGRDAFAAATLALPAKKTLSAGIIDGRNIWRTDLHAAIALVEKAASQLGERFMVSASCSLMHVPVDLAGEKKLDNEIKSWLAFATQKLEELLCLKGVFSGEKSKFSDYLEKNMAAIESRRKSTRIHRPEVAKALEQITQDKLKRKSPFEKRYDIQNKKLNLPLFPTTTIGSFPQTAEIRNARLSFKNGNLTEAAYEKLMQDEVKLAVKEQEALGLDVLVHGEPERNDMVEYFGELMDGFTFTSNGWVQSYGSRCVKPPVIFGDVSRPAPMTVAWSKYAQSQTKKWMKGMLTGPVTILQWSFVRDDQPRERTCKQIALALLSEVQDLEKAGIAIIQVDEPALREGLPLRRKDWDSYLKWSCEAFKLATSDVADDTQIHTHMCYCEFNDIMPAISSLDADVISIETSRSQMELLDGFKTFKYPNAIGPGVYDIHSPRVPSTDEMIKLLEKAAELLPAEKLWVNPDCGLKTRGWEETKKALRNMAEAAVALRKKKG